MSVKATLSFTDRHHRFIARKVEEGVFETTSAAVAAAVEQMIEDERARDIALSAVVDELRVRMSTPVEDFIAIEQAFDGLTETAVKHGGT